MCLGLRCLIVICVLLAGAGRAGAIGWDSDDFLIGGGPSFTNKIGVFDHDLSFKGLLDPNFLTVRGMDFDAQGHLVAVASFHREVRVYDSSGAHIGGFVRPDDALGAAADLKVAPDGTYLIGPQNQFGATGARQFDPQGAFVRQYGSGNVSGIAVVPGNKFWASGLSSPTITIFDLVGGGQVGTIAVAGLTAALSMSYSASTNTVLLPDTLSSTVLETDLTGTVLEEFHAPSATSFVSVVRGPDADVFATTGGGQSILRWHANGDFAGSVATSATLGNSGWIVWAGNIPEPTGWVSITIALYISLWRRRHKRKV